MSSPESTLKKKSHSIAYDLVCENIANGTLHMGYEPHQTNWQTFQPRHIEEWNKHVWH